MNITPKKYELMLDSFVEFMGVKLYRIRALMKFGNVEQGELGGYIATEKNLTQAFGNAWVSDNARVYDNARVSGDARVYGNVWVYDNARVYGNAQVSGDARVYGDAQVSGDARVYDNARVYGNAWVSGDDKIKITPINIIGLTWSVTITSTHMCIGCERHTHADWGKFKSKRIKIMNDRAVDFWKQHKAMLLALCKSHAKAKC